MLEYARLIYAYIESDVSLAQFENILRDFERTAQFIEQYAPEYRRIRRRSSGYRRFENGLNCDESGGPLGSDEYGMSFSDFGICPWGDS